MRFIIFLNSAKAGIRTKEYNYQAHIYFGGKDGSLIQFGKPIIFDETRQHFMFPNEARLRDLTYDAPICLNIVEKIVEINQNGKENILEINYHNKIIIGMTVQSTSIVEW